MGAILLLWAGLCLAGPKVEVDNSVFTFDTVPEGVGVSHDFIIKNSGDTLLKILKVAPP